MMEPVILIITLAAFGEVVIEVLKPLLDPLVDALSLPETVNPYLYLSCAFGVLLSFSYQVNILVAIGVQSPNTTAHVTGLIATGLILGRGSNFVHDVFARLTDRTGSIKVSTTSPEKSASRTAVTVSTSQEGEE